MTVEGDNGDANLLLSWLVELVNVETLKTSLPTLEALSRIPVILNHKLTSWCNFKSLQVEVELKGSFRYQHPQITIMMKQIDENNEVASGKPWKGNTEL